MRRAESGFLAFLGVLALAMCACGNSPRVEARTLPPVTMTVDGQPVTIEVVKTRDQTIIRYTLPSTVFPFKLPVLRSGEAELQPLSYTPTGSVFSIHYGPAADDRPLSLLVDGLLPADKGIEAWATTIHLEQGRATRPGDDSSGDNALLTLVSQERTGAAPEILGASWRKAPTDYLDEVRIGMTFVGRSYWGGDPPVTVLGDGHELPVRGYGGSNGETPVTHLEFGLLGDDLPRFITVVRGIDHALPPVEIELHP